MKKLILIAVALLLFFAISAFAWPEGNCAIKVTNVGSEKLFFRVYWIDHPHQDIWLLPFTIAGGELEPGAKFQLGSEFPPGDYYIEWSLAKDDGTNFNAALDFRINGHDIGCTLAISEMPDSWGVIKTHAA